MAQGPAAPGRPSSPGRPGGSEAERWSWIEQLADRMDRPLTVAGVLFALLVLAETTMDVGPRLATAFTTLSWVLWFLFAGEFAVRLLVAPSRSNFLRRSWWQLIFLALPFFRFLRPLSRLRLGRLTRLGRTLSAGIRTGRTATRRLSGRVAWLGSLTSIVVLSSSQILFLFGSYDAYGDALHAAALAAITGAATGQEAGIARVLDVVLAIFSVVVFASLAGILGAYFVEHRTETPPPSSPPADAWSPPPSGTTQPERPA